MTGFSYVQAACGNCEDCSNQRNLSCGTMVLLIVLIKVSMNEATVAHSLFAVSVPDRCSLIGSVVNQ